MKQLLFCTFMLAVALAGKAQTLEKMQWFTEPQSHEIKGKTMTVDVPGHCPDQRRLEWLKQHAE